MLMDILLISNSFLMECSNRKVVFKIRNKAVMVFIVLVSLMSITCVSAEDYNGTDVSLTEPEPSDLKAVEESEPSANGTADESQCYLKLDNDADIENIYIGEYVTWIISVINKGPDTAKNVNVYDQLPDGLKYVSHTASKGTFNPQTGIWSIGDLSILDGEVFLNITTKALTSGEKVNKATVTSDTFNLNANESYEEEEIDVFEHESNADKAVDFVNATGNPIALMLISLFAIILAPGFKR